MVSGLSLRNAAIVLATAHAAMAQTLNAMTYVGCYSSSSGLTLANTAQYQTEGLCQETCVQQKGNQAVLGLTNKDTCYCGNSAPPTSAKVDDSMCSYGCNGFGSHPCGGPGYFTIYLTGAASSVSAVGGGTVSSGSSSAAPSIATSASSSTSLASSSTTSAGATVVTTVLAGQTVTQTAYADAAQTTKSSTNSGSGSGASIGGIVGGVVGGVIALFLLVGAGCLWRRRKQKAAAEEAYRQNQVNDFMRESKSSSATTNSTTAKADSRFDAEAMAHRRLSDGSIADNEDYSRRILKVTNA